MHFCSIGAPRTSGPNFLDHALGYTRLDLAPLLHDTLG